MTQTAGITKQALDGFYGPSQWYRHPFGRLVYTDGIHFLVENGAAWLLDVVASYQSAKLDQQTEGFQLWILKVNADRSCVVTCQADSNTPNLVEQKIPYTDFPLDEIKLYVEGEGKDRVCLLPQEH